jgi:uncharacterized protein
VAVAHEPAAASTLVSNPLTCAPIYVAAYQVGSSLLGEVQRFAAVGKPIMLGLTLFATVGRLAAYLVTLLGWRLAVLLRS